MMRFLSMLCECHRPSISAVVSALSMIERWRWSQTMRRHNYYYYCSSTLYDHFTRYDTIAFVCHPYWFSDNTLQARNASSEITRQSTPRGTEPCAWLIIVILNAGLVKWRMHTNRPFSQPSSNVHRVSNDYTEWQTRGS